MKYCINIKDDYSLLFNFRKTDFYISKPKGTHFFKNTMNAKEITVYQIFQNSEVSDKKYCLTVLYTLQKIAGREMKLFDRDGNRVSVPETYEEFKRTIKEDYSGEIMVNAGSSENKVCFIFRTGIIPGTIIAECPVYHTEGISTQNIMKLLKSSINEVMSCFNMKISVGRYG